MTAPLDVYFPQPPPDRGPSESRHRVAQLLRALAESCVTLDVDASGAAALDAVGDRLSAALTDLDRLPRQPEPRVPPGASFTASLAERGPFVGAGNPLAAPLRLSIDGDLVRGWAVYGHAYEGGVGDMHGGTVMAAFDDVLGCAQMLGSVIGRTGTLTVRFRAASPIGERIDYLGRLDHVEGRKVFCSGEARCNGVVLAEADAIFVAPPAAVSDRTGI